MNQTKLQVPLSTAAEKFTKQNHLQQLLTNISTPNQAHKQFKSRVKESFSQSLLQNFGGSVSIETSSNQSKTKISLNNTHSKRYFTQQSSISSPQQDQQMHYLSLQISTGTSALVTPSSHAKREIYPKAAERNKKLLASETQALTSSPFNRDSSLFSKRKKETSLFFQALSSSPYSIQKQPPMSVYEQIAPFITLYNTQKIIDKFPIKLPPPSSLYPKDYLSQKKKEVEMKYCRQTAYKIISDIDTEKKSKIRKLEYLQAKARREKYIRQWQERGIFI